MRLLHREDARDERVPPAPFALRVTGEGVDFPERRRREGPGKAGGGARGEYQFERIGDVDSADRGDAARKTDRHAMFGFLGYRRAVQSEK